MLTDTPTRRGPVRSDSSPSHSSTPSIDSVKCTRHAIRPEQPNPTDADNGSSRRWKQPFRALARGCRTVLPNLRTILTKRRTPALQTQQPAAPTQAISPDPLLTSLTSTITPLQPPNASCAISPSATRTTNAPRPPKPNPTSRVSTSSILDPSNRNKSIFLAEAPIQLYYSPGHPQPGIKWGTVLYDSGCDYDIISTGHLAECSKPAADVQKRTFAMSITGEPFDYLYKVHIRWKDENFTNLKWLETECLVVEAEFFDIIIGRKTMERLQLYVRNPKLIGPLLTPLPPVDDSPAAKAARAQAARIKREQELQSQNEEESRR
ncbi:hypothetical protein DE146DRAFT_142424 [Phaeosphaeria sp. MPI-PUGE-AT-0046c]|nr:hypothetical protein DE146DRAFT_142424 [Phaeosphaeria sp. MPI-PUGE-AT-0046c]